MCARRDSTGVKGRVGFALSVLSAVSALLGCTSDPPGSGSTMNVGGDALSGGGVVNGAGASSVGGAGAPNTAGATATGGDVATGGALGHGGTAGNGGTGLAGSAGSAGSAAVVSSLPGCALQFPYQDEAARGTWLGGDSAYSTVLSPTTALWSFQDTFVGKHGQTSRQGAGLIANSFAYVKCENGVGSIEYFWRQSANSTGAIFSDGVANNRFWPQQPIIYKSFLFAAMTRVEGGANEIGTALARVSNPFDAPDTWQVEYFDLSTLSGLGKGTIVVDNYAYLFGNAGQAVVTRLPLDELIKPGALPAALLEYLASDGQWKPGLDTANAKKLGFSANVGTSFRYLKGTSKWLVLFTNTSGWPSATISVSTAPELAGPWSKPVDVYQVPEMTVGSPEYEKDNVCYAGIEHNESNPAPDTDLLFSYTCNSLVGAKQVANMAIYLPKIVKLKNPVAN
jgi:hypothetical protein